MVYRRGRSKKSTQYPLGMPPEHLRPTTVSGTEVQAKIVIYSNIIKGNDLIVFLFALNRLRKFWTDLKKKYVTIETLHYLLSNFNSKHIENWNKLQIQYSNIV